MAVVDCLRCGEATPALEQAPLPGDDGQLVKGATCAACWHEWTEEEVRTINELRLNFMDPESQKILRTRMLTYLGFETEAEAEPLCDRSAETPASSAASTDNDSSSD